MDKKLTVMEMSKYLGVSKEAIYNRIRRGTLVSVLENGKKYIVLTDALAREGRLPKRSAIASNLDSDYVDLLKTQLEELKLKNQKLEEDKDRLVRDKERLLIESKEKIEQIYKERDEQLRMILTLSHVPSLENQPTNKNEEMAQIIEEEDEESQEQDIVEMMCESFEDWTDLRRYLDEKNYSDTEQKIINKRIKKRLGKDENLKSAQGEVYIKKGTKLKNIIGKIL